MKPPKYERVTLADWLAIVAGRVRAKRLRRGWSQRQLALTAGLKQSAVAMLEGGQRAPGLRVLYRVAVALGCDVGSLTKGSRRKVGAPLLPAFAFAYPCTGGTQEEPDDNPQRMFHGEEE